MVQRRTVDLLPEIFRTQTNKQFLAATLDQITAEPNLKRTQGFVGRRVGPGVNPRDSYVVEPTATRQDYQLEPAVTFFEPETTKALDAITYPGMIDALNLLGANTDRQDRLWESQYYSWDPFCDLDKFSNYSQYYWLPSGPDSVDVFSGAVPLSDSWTVTPQTLGYQFTGEVGLNPTLQLARGGNYTFDISGATTPFYIQAAPGVQGLMPGTVNISSRTVLGVSGNGTSTVRFDVPSKDAQQFYYSLPFIGQAVGKPAGTVDLVTDLKFDQINNIYVSEFLAANPSGIDGITSLDGRTVVFTNTIANAEDGGWQINTQFDPLIRTSPEYVGASVSYDVTGQPYDDLPYETITDIIISGEPDPLDGLPGSYDSLPFDQTIDIDQQSQRYSVWQIQFVYDNQGQPYMRLTSVLPVADLSKFRVLFGNVNANTSWYKDASGYFQQIPLLTAALDTLYYQDGSDPARFGRIELVDQPTDNPIYIDDIVGAKTYTSPNGVTFTNGLKIQIRGVVEPARYQNLEFYIEGVGTGPGIDARVGFIDGEAYFGPWHYFQGNKLTGASHSETEFQQYIYDTVDLSIINHGVGYPVGGTLPVTSQMGATAGNGIKLLPVTDFVTPETYTESASSPFDPYFIAGTESVIPGTDPAIYSSRDPFTDLYNGRDGSFDTGGFDGTLNAPLIPDYLTINRASRDLNAWTRSNRWFHKDVIQATADYNNQTAIFNNELRAKRPIIEFRPNIDLFNFGTQGKQPVDIIDFTQTDAFSNVNGTVYYGIDGYVFAQGSRVIFAADRDPNVRNRVYVVNFVNTTGDNNDPLIIDLVPADNSEVFYDQTIVCLSGQTLQGLSFWYDGTAWISAQQKTGVNQAPLFDIYDLQGRSLGDRATYPSTTFAGSKLFGYALGTTEITDNVLGFSLKYLNIDNVGDIVFDNYFYNDTFLYVVDSVSKTENISIGYAREYIDRTLFTNLIGWLPAAQENRSRQIFRFVYDGSPLVLDVPIDQNTVFAPLQIFQGTEYIDPTGYTVSLPGDGSTVITLTNPPELGTIIEVQAISNQASSVAFYQIPANLESNVFNENSTNFTLGTIRTHYQGIGQNLREIQGPIDGANNTRDLGNILPWGDNIIQNSSPLSLAGTFLRRQQFEVISSIEFNSREYQKYKARLIDLAGQGDYVNNTTTEILDTIMDQISSSRSDVAPFYWSDMIPNGGNYTTTTYIYSVISTPTFTTSQTYDFESSNYLGLSVYLNGEILTRGYDYVVSTDSPTFTITSDLSVGDSIVVREYSATYGSYVPNTPTKMGLYQAFKPEIYLDETYITPTLVIRGHDGSITVAYGDYRDAVLLEFETRIFNNLKIVTPVPLQIQEVIPGQFRTTDYTLSEINTILAPDFLAWVGWNKLDYTDQTYLGSDPFTYNYSQSANKINNQPLPGAWRGIYNYLYDTFSPNTRPWEMLGFSQEPTWWQDYYGPAPYTQGNLVLWEDLAQGLVRDPAGEYVRPEFARPDLLQVIPSGDEGQLLPPLDVAVANYDNTSFRRSWTFGDDGPVENAWRTSSAWPFAVMRLLALTKPAKFFSLLSDRDRYVYNETLDQYLWNDRYRLNANNLAPLYGDGVSRASYINWVIDYNRQLGVNSTVTLTDTLTHLGIRLAWRVGGFTDKNLLKIYTERSTPNSQNASLLLPDESYQILLYKNQPYQQSVFSSVIIQTVEDGWQVLGYNNFKPYFNILTSVPNGNTMLLEAGGTTVRIAQDHSQDVTQVPYGYTFTNRTAVCDFIYSYGLLLDQQGFVFETQENGYIMDWLQMCREFLYWSNQGWAVNSIINLNPGATKVSVTTPGSVVDSLVTLRPENLVLNQNRQPLPTAELVIERLDNTFSAMSLTSNTINYLNANLTAFEHLVLLDNVSIFADLIYSPVTAARQSRVLVSGYISGDWNGTVNAPGFVLNQDTIAEWVPNRTYAKGEIVLFKNEYWSASTIIQPSQSFDYTNWIKSDYDEIMKGLLPNAANSSDQLATAYSTYNASLESEVDLFSFGLIGFRPRQYMSALNIDDVSQVQLYQQFLGSKGTIRSAEIFSFADIGKETAQYDIYEYWGILSGQYGATANRNYIELLLKEQLLLSDPSLVQVIQPTETSQADQTVLLDNVWKSTVPLTSTDILPTIVAPVKDSALPSAGYVNLEDVSISVMTLDDLTFEDVTTIGEGTTIWVAKSNDYDWTVYRVDLVNATVVEVSDNLDGRSLVTFNNQHGLVAGDWLIIKNFDTAVDGAYSILSVPSLDTAVIDFSFTGEQVSLVGIGLALTLQTARVDQASDVVSLPYANSLVPGDRAWVDNDGSGYWAVFEKTDPFAETPVTSILPPNAIDGSLFGTSLTQGFQNLAAMVGAPNYPSSGAIYTYVKTTAQDTYDFNFIQTLDTTDAVGYGNDMQMGDQTWAVVGASASNNNRGYAVVIYNPITGNEFGQHQLLLDPAGSVDDLFGHAVAISKDEKWIYVGAPGANSVYAYGRVDIQRQVASYTTDGLTFRYDFDNQIYVSQNGVLAAEQLAVLLNGTLLTANTDYTVTGSTLTLTSVPAFGLPLVITRRIDLFADGDGSTDTFDLQEIYTATSTSSLSVYIDQVIQRPGVDYSFTYDAIAGYGTVVFVTPPAVDTTIYFRSSEAYFKLVDIITVAGLDASAGFGHSVATSTDGRTVLIGCPERTVTTNGITYDGAGTVYAFNRSVQNFQITNASELSYTTIRNIDPLNPNNVLLNNQFLINQGPINQTQNINGQFTIAGNTVTLNSTAPISVGDILTVETNNFDLVQTIIDEAPSVGAGFGSSVDLCINNCSLYLGAPYDSTVLPEAGHVDYRQNQSRLYGSTTSNSVNPTLTPGQYLSVNDYMVQMTMPTYSSVVTYSAGDVVLDGTSVFVAKIPVPAGTNTADDTYWKPSNYSAAMVKNINDAEIPNVQASLNSDVGFTGDGSSTQFNIGTLYSSAQAYVPLVYINNILQTLGTDYTYDNSTEIVTFVTPPGTNSDILVVGGRLVISNRNQAAATSRNKLTVLPGSSSDGSGPGSLFATLDFETFAWAQTITSPIAQDYAHFGKALFISTEATNLVVGAPDGTAIESTTFDNGTTYFDSGSTDFYDGVPNSGVVYTYDFLPSANTTINNPGQFVFGQQIYDDLMSTLDQFGSALDYTTGVLLIGSPGEDYPPNIANAGRVAEFVNPTLAPAWTITRRQTPVVNIDLMNTVFIYDRIGNNTKQYFDFFDPLQGKLLGAVRQNLDYIGAVDPAAYNVGSVNNYGQRWAQNYVGQIWWDTSNARFIDPNQDDIVYASRRWGQLFPGSTVDVYQWTANAVPPAQYSGPGTPRSLTNYCVTSAINEQGLFVTNYYYWVQGIRTVNRAAKKTLGIETITRYIEDPKSSGISYIAPINASTVAIYNGLEYIQAEDTILHIEYDQEVNDDAIHVQYQLIPQDRADGFLSDNLYRKLQDSFCGVDTDGNPVPNPLAPVSERYGVLFRPRQSMFVNRFLALQNYLEQANRVMAQYPIVETRSFSLLTSSEPEPAPSSGAWDKRVATYAELTYQDLFQVAIGYRYLVAVDDTNSGLWTIYQVANGVLPGERVLALVRVQNYNTNLYWQHKDWYQPGYNPLTLVSAEVPNYSDLEALVLPTGSSVKVAANGQGKYEIYLYDGTVWNRVGLQDGTIEIKSDIWDYSIGRFGFDVEVFDAQYYDQEPVIETRKIIQSLNQEIFIEDLQIERNRLLILMFNYILSEQTAPLWLTKTSMIDVDHKIRSLVPFQIYRQDNQDFVLNYIQEVKPYHTQIREFNLIYTGFDEYQGTVNDFDLPAYWDPTQNLFVSPVLDDNTDYPLSTTSSVPSSSQVWQTLPWNQWYQNYTLTFESITLVDGGTGYTEPPIVIIGEEWLPNTAYVAGQQFYYDDNLYTVQQPGVTGSVPPTFVIGSQTNGTALLSYAGLKAIAEAAVNSSGAVIAVSIVQPGSGYLLTPAVILIEGNGTGARATAVLGNSLVRDITTTIKYDRYQYTSDIGEWQANVSYPQGTQVRYADRVWSADAVTITSTFDPDDWTVVPASDLTGIDRTQGYYAPSVNMPGLDLAQLISGLDYPGVQVDAPDFNQNTGFDVGNYDTNPYDNIAYGPEGLPTYDPAILDTIFESDFLDSYLGTRPTDINVDGGGFVDVFSSHAPEELIPGAIFDTLDLRVFTTPGSDWNVDGHGFPANDIDYVYDSSTATYSFADLVAYPIQVRIWNVSNGVRLIQDQDYTVDWVDYTVSIVNGVSQGQSLSIMAYALGGGNQIFDGSYIGDGSTATLILPVDYNLINSMAIFRNGEVENTADYTYQPEFSVTGVQSPYNGSNGTTLQVNSTAGILLGSRVSNPGYTAGQTVISIDSDTTVTTSAPPNATPSGIVTFLPYTYTTSVTFDTALAVTDRVTIGALGNGNPTTYSWSTPITVDYISTGSLTFALTSSQLQGTNPSNLVVEVNGRRARPAQGVEYVGNGSTVTFDLPERGGYSLDLVVPGNIQVYVNNQPQTLSADWILDGYDASTLSRSITFINTPALGDQILISVDYAADYTIVGTNLVFSATSSVQPVSGSVVSVTTFNDTAQQEILTQVFQGPTAEGIAVGEGYDETNYDVSGIYTEIPNPLYPIPDGANATVWVRSAASDAYNGQAGSYSYLSSSIVETNRFDTGREIDDPNRLIVTLDGYYLFPGSGYTVDGSVVTVLGPVINAAQVVAITSETQSVVPGAIAFRIFQDMRGMQSTYRITPATSTVLVQSLSATDDVIYVEDASHLTEPNLPLGIFGLITINGERIAYRERDLAANTVSGLRRGTVGTGTGDVMTAPPVPLVHLAGTPVYDIGNGNLLPAEYQNTPICTLILADGVQTVFVAPNIDLSGLPFNAVEAYDETTFSYGDVSFAPGSYAYGETGPDNYLRVSVGGIELGYEQGYVTSADNPAEITFDVAPPEGVEVSMCILQSQGFYNTAEVGVSLQEQDTLAARFIRGQ